MMDTTGDASDASSAPLGESFVLVPENSGQVLSSGSGEMSSDLRLLEGNKDEENQSEVPQGLSGDDDEEIQFLENSDGSQQRLPCGDAKKQNGEAGPSASFHARELDLDKCDCLIANCPGCHYPCKHCWRRTCGHICKLQRVWNYQEVEVQGRGVKRTKNSEIQIIDDR